MQKNLPLYILGLFILNTYSMSGQDELRRVDRFINFNFQNEIRLEWPAGFGGWSYRELDKSIQLNGEYVSFILNNLKEIQFEMQAELPLDIRIYSYRGLIRLDIHKSSKAVSYLYKDSSLIFTGLHVIHLFDEVKPQVSIYFDSVEGLSKLGELNFQQIFSSIKNDIYENPMLSKKELNKATELIYHQNGDELTYTGQLKEQTKRVFTIASLWGVQVAPGTIGIAVMPEFAVIKYSVNREGISHVNSMHAVSGRVILFDKMGSLGIKYAYLKSIKTKGDYVLYGTGLGMYYLGTSEGEFQYGPTISFIRENRKLRLEWEIGYPLVNRDVWTNINITAVYKF
jgi:hypothetical protein